ncbi:hypothetical protein PR202_ga21694 [Eleusine coracana subsp. coracana]|uniref:Uncharacterized protein n=1 Tax=Eleusine coracana subsp. coracana TaxID=191504 RepID=A0AAV5D1P9_ELECO|nr:hypothetical protein PR202_ga21694 [Eleusine coracana subsp. coracana]
MFQACQAEAMHHRYPSNSRWRWSRRPRYGGGGGGGGAPTVRHGHGVRPVHRCHSPAAVGARRCDGAEPAATPPGPEEQYYCLWRQQQQHHRPRVPLGRQGLETYQFSSNTLMNNGTCCKSESLLYGMSIYSVKTNQLYTGMDI